MSFTGTTAPAPASSGLLTITGSYFSMITQGRKVAEDRPEIDRGPLQSMLLNALQPGTVIWDSHFARLEAKDHGWLIHFKNGTAAYADMVIGADGANSKIRPYLTPIQPVYSGITIVEGNLYEAARNAPQLYDLVKGGKSICLRPTPNP